MTITKWQNFKGALYLKIFGKIFGIVLGEVSELQVRQPHYRALTIGVNELLWFPL